MKFSITNISQFIEENNIVSPVKALPKILPYSQIIKCRLAFFKIPSDRAECWNFHEIVFILITNLKNSFIQPGSYIGHKANNVAKRSKKSYEIIACIVTRWNLV